MQIYVGKNGQQLGPYTLLQIHEMLEAAEITGDTPGWMAGESGWKPLRDLPPVLSLIQSLEKEKLDAELAKSDRPTLAPPSTVPPQRLPSHAISRFGARMVDLMVFQVIIGLVWSLPEPPQSMPNPDDYENVRDFFAALWKVSQDTTNTEQMAYAWKVLYFQLGSVFAWHLIEPLLLALTSTTLGKWVFRIRVCGPDGGKPGFFRSLYRSLLLFLFGMGAGFEPLRWIANFCAFFRVQSKGVAFWDELAHTRVDQGPFNPGRSFLILLVLIILIVADSFLPR
ncbi:MAG: RDD family protein [Verrucomicrobia bacterium]|nr:RDD family protein [Verrucomicrobiota bacterium]